MNIWGWVPVLFVIGLVVTLGVALFQFVVYAFIALFQFVVYAFIMAAAAVVQGVAWAWGKVRRK